MTSTDDMTVTASPLRAVYVVYDFVCPYSYIAQRDVERLEDEYPIPTPRWRPHWLHPDVPQGGRPMPAEIDEARRQAVLAWLAEMAPEVGGSMRFPARQQYSLHAFAAMELAADHGAAAAARVRRAIFDALWLDSRDIGELGTITELLDESGVAADALLLDGRPHLFHRRAIAAVQTARRLSLTTTPTVILGRTAVAGWHFYEVLQQVVEEQGVAPRGA